MSRFASALSAMLLCLGASGSVASAEIRTGEAFDPAGDGAGTPAQDLVGAAAHYDTVTGEMVVRATLNADVASAQRTTIILDVGTGADGVCLGSGIGVTVFARTDSDVADYNTPIMSYRPFVPQDSGGRVTGIRNGRDIAFRVAPANVAQALAMQNKPYNCMNVTVEKTFDINDVYDPSTWEDGSPQKHYDSLSSPLMMTAQPSPPAVTCPKPKHLVGKSVRQARRVIRRSGCEVARIDRPRSARKRLVVKRAYGAPRMTLVARPSRR